MPIDETPGTKEYYLKAQKVIDKYLKDVFSKKDNANHYSKDGVINPEVYFGSNKARICFVLKENHSFDIDKGDVLWYPVADDVLFHHVDNTNRYWATNIIRVERFIHHGMHTDCASIPKYSSKAEALSAGDYCTGIGYINIKKYDNHSSYSIHKDIDSYVFKEAAEEPAKKEAEEAAKKEEKEEAKEAVKKAADATAREIRFVNSEALRIQLNALMPDYIIACDASNNMLKRLKYLLNKENPLGWRRYRPQSQEVFKEHDRPEGWCEFLLSSQKDAAIIHVGSNNLFYIVKTGERKMVIINWFHPSFKYSGDGKNDAKWSFQAQHEKLEKIKTEVNELVRSGVLGKNFEIPDPIQG